MKILLLLEATLGGTARHILDLTEGLLAEGHEVHLLYSTRRADNAFLKGLTALRGRFYSTELAIHRAVGVSDISVYMAVRKYVHQNGPFDILHSHSTKAGFILRLLGRRKGATSIYTPHGLMTQNGELRGLRRWAVAMLESFLARRCDRVIAVSAIERICAIDTGIPPHKITVIHNGLNPRARVDRTKRALMRVKLDIPPDTICIGAIGLLVPNKEFARLIEAFGVLRQQTTVPVRLVILGWGSEEANLRDQVTHLALDDHVQLLGQASGVEHFPAFDIFAHSSRYEGFAYTFLEALSAQIPIVTTRVGGAEETVEPGVNGYICDPWDTLRFASKLKQLVEDPALREKMGRVAGAKLSRFAAARMVNETIDLYRQLRPGPRTGAELSESLPATDPQ